MLKSNLICAVIALVSAVTISSAFTNGNLTSSSLIAMNEAIETSIQN